MMDQSTSNQQAVNEQYEALQPQQDPVQQPQSNVTPGYTATPSTRGTGMSTGTQWGIGIAVVVVLLAVVLGLVFGLKKTKNAKPGNGVTKPEHTLSKSTKTEPGAKMHQGTEQKATVAELKPAVKMDSSILSIGWVGRQTDAVGFVIRSKDNSGLLVSVNSKSWPSDPFIVNESIPEKSVVVVSTVSMVPLEAPTKDKGTLGFTFGFPTTGHWTKSTITTLDKPSGDHQTTVDMGTGNVLVGILAASISHKHTDWFVIMHVYADRSTIEFSLSSGKGNYSEVKDPIKLATKAYPNIPKKISDLKSSFMTVNQSYFVAGFLDTSNNVVRYYSWKTEKAAVDVVGELSLGFKIKDVAISKDGVVMLILTEGGLHTYAYDIPSGKYVHGHNLALPDNLYNGVESCTLDPEKHGDYYHCAFGTDNNLIYFMPIKADGTMMDGHLEFIKTKMSKTDGPLMMHILSDVDDGVIMYSSTSGDVEATKISVKM